MSLPRSRVLARLAAYQLAFSIVGVGYFVHATFGHVTLDQAVWHLVYADGAAMVMSEVFFVECAVAVLVVPFLLALCATLAHTWSAPRLAGWRRTLLRGAPAMAGLAAVFVLGLQFSVFSYAAAYLEPDQFARDFVAAEHVQTTPERRRNLILIYAESLEEAYSDPALFGRDLLAPLRAQGGHSFAYRPAAGANWTTAGMVATQCGVPLRVYAQNDVRLRGGDKAFLPGATCLGDVLQGHGYHNVFLGGVPLSFAGKGSFLRDHGYQETWGREEWDRHGARPEDYNIWGLWDSELFERARTTLDRLHASGKPFNLTLLTLDTHNPFGFLSPACHAQGARKFEDIVACSAREIAAFIDYARQKGYLEDTLVVVVGDHLAVPNPVYDKLVQGGQYRGIFNLFLGKDLPPANRQELMPFDLFPTVLEMLGVRVAGDRAGLGYSAVGPAEAVPPEGRVEQWSLARLNGSSRYDRLWQPREPARRD